MDVRLSTDLLRKPGALLLSCALAASLCPAVPQVAYADNEQAAVEESQDGDESGEIEKSKLDQQEPESDDGGDERNKTPEESPGDVNAPKSDDLQEDALQKDLQATEKTPATNEEDATPSETDEPAENAEDEKALAESVIQNDVEYFFELNEGGASITRMVSHAGSLGVFTVPTTIEVEGESYPVVSFAWDSSSSVTAGSVIVPAGVRVTDLSGLANAQATTLEVQAGAVLDGAGPGSGYLFDSISVGSGAYVNMALAVPSAQNLSIADGAVIVTPITIAEEDPLLAMAVNSPKKSAMGAQSIEAGTTQQPIETPEGTFYVNADENSVLTITAFVAKDSGQLDTLTIPNTFTVDGKQYGVSAVSLESGGGSSFQASTVVVADGLTVLNLDAAKNAMSLVLGSGVVYNASSFNGNAMTMNNTLTSLAVGSGVTFITGFQYCTALSSLSFGSGAQFVNSQFANCTALTAVDLNGNPLVGSMFSKCTSLATVSGVSGSIPASAFNGCSALASFDFSNVSGSIGENAFASCKKLGGALSFENVTIGNNAFKQTDVTAVVVSGGSASIGESAFASCASLTSIDLDVAQINKSAFKSCKNLSAIKISSNVEYIDATAFNGIAASPSITFAGSNNGVYRYDASENAILNDYDLHIIPYVADDANVAGITEINQFTSGKSNAYKNNYDKNTLTFTVGKCVQAISAALFSHSNSLVTVINRIDVVDGNKHFKVGDDGALYSIDGTVLIKVPMNVTQFDVPDGVTTIRGSAFAYCYDLESVTLPNTLTYIDRMAFVDCGKLTEINIPDSVLDIDTAAFSGTSLVSFKPGSGLWTEDKISDSSKFNQDGGVPNVNWLFVRDVAANSVQAWTGGNVLYRSLSTLDLSNYQAAFIPYYAFAGLSGIAEVQIPSTVTHIGSGAFYYCDNLMTVYCYAPDSMVIDMANTGHGDSGSGDANESYVINAPGAFSYWDVQKEPATDGTGSKFEDRTGITFYGCAYNNDLRVWCGSYGQTFIPVVTLQTLSGVDNPFWNKTMASSFAIDYGDDATDYSYVQIANIEKGGMPEVLAKFGQYDGVRDLTNDSACTITYYDPDGNRVTSFDKDGVYTASLVGDGKSVFGARMVKFNVGTVEEPAAEEPAAEEPAAEEPGDSKADGNASEAPVTDNANAGASNTAATATQGVHTVYQTTYVPAATSAVQSVESGNSNTYAVNDAALPEALEGIAETDGSVLVWGGSNAASPQYVWEVSGSKLTKDNIAQLNFQVVDASKDPQVVQLMGGTDFAAFTVKQNGSFPASFKLHWKTSSTFYDGAKVDVYRLVASSGTAEGDMMLELVKSGVVATDGYVTVDVGQGGTYVLVESEAFSGFSFVETAYADTGEAAAADAGAQQASNWMLPAAIAAVAAAFVGACGGLFARGRRKDAGQEQTSEQER